jgi:hypothetical protein
MYCKRINLTSSTIFCCDNHQKPILSNAREHKPLGAKGASAWTASPPIY